MYFLILFFKQKRLRIDSVIQKVIQQNQVKYAIESPHVFVMIENENQEICSSTSLYTWCEVPEFIQGRVWKILKYCSSLYFHFGKIFNNNIDHYTQRVISQNQAKYDNESQHIFLMTKSGNEEMCLPRNLYTW